MVASGQQMGRCAQDRAAPVCQDVVDGEQGRAAAGLRSPCRGQPVADLAHGYERVVIVAPVAAGIGFMASPRRQAAALAAAGARVALVQPDRAAVRAIGRNVLDVSRRAAAARAGLAQAAAVAPAVRAVWQA